MINNNQNSILQGKRILYINDNPWNLSQMHRKLSKTGVKLFQATSAKEALSIAKKSIDLAIINMSVSSTNAHKTSKVLKLNQPDLIILVECNSSKEELIETLNKQLQSFLN